MSNISEAMEHRTRVLLTNWLSFLVGYGLEKNDTLCVIKNNFMT